ncbi:plasmid mobilization relaxosome protein MobC [Acetobacter pasteurianus]|uniref:plasmid mobilization relaxosome protein MobC n=1 Tax=Acetobacter pasteurianus TaxID=438 RepID=UPI000FF94E48|nr:plasmid mobilization relaxosome protein MobC [Acetobacter pasteurianus]GCD57338.1 hypothetical protein NBRC3222_2675 [Acetobacter pasteurianus NBRC 3222]
MSKLSETVALRLTPTDADIWEQTALDAGYRNRGAWVRSVVSQHLHVGQTDLPRELLELRYELAKIGANLNQISHRLNGKVLGGVSLDLARALSLFDDTTETIQQAIVALVPAVDQRRRGRKRRLR